MSNLKTCECRPRWSAARGYHVVKCPHCIEVERVARELAKSAWFFSKDLQERARACGLLED